MDINLTGPMRLTKAVAPVMQAQGRGRIVNIASVAGLAPTGSSIAYAVSKAGLIHLTRCMAVALAPETLVNCVAPGLLEGTRATANLRADQIERSASGSLLKKAADKDDCADMVVTMCRTETMTGQTIVIDSGPRVSLTATIFRLACAAKKIQLIVSSHGWTQARRSALSCSSFTLTDRWGGQCSRHGKVAVIAAGFGSGRTSTWTCCRIVAAVSARRRAFSICRSSLRTSSCCVEKIY